MALEVPIFVCLEYNHDRPGWRLVDLTFEISGNMQLLAQKEQVYYFQPLELEYCQDQPTF